MADDFSRNVDFVSEPQLLADLADWERRLPWFDAFAGVPRGGAWLAAWLAMRRNVPQLELSRIATRSQPRTVRSVLVVDDNWRDVPGHTLDKVQAMLSGGNAAVEYASMYIRADERPQRIRYWYARTYYAPIFGYDWHRRHYVKLAGLDMDGVICEDWSGSETTEPWRYQQFLRQAAPWQFRGRGVSVGAVVTGRLEKHREATKAWLAANRVEYRQLLMYPGTAESREAKQDYWHHKAAYLARPDVWFFVESCPRQAAAIAEATRKPVLCLRTGHCHNGRVVLEKQTTG